MNGGDGECGQNGGNGGPGKDGRNGSELSKQEFKEKYPHFFSQLNKIKKGHTNIKETKKLFGTRYHCTMKSPNGNDVVYSKHVKHTQPLREGYCLHKGGPGTQGTAGGNGGKEGQGGEGGYRGKLEINSLAERYGVSNRKYYGIKVEDFQGRDGNAGKRGTGGRGGLDGRRGIDHVWMKVLKNDLKFLDGRLSIVECRDKKRKWKVKCSKTGRNVKIQEGTVENRKKKQDGVKGKNKQTEQSQVDKDATKKNAILTDELRQEYSHLFEQRSKNNLEEILARIAAVVKEQNDLAMENQVLTDDTVNLPEHQHQNYSQTEQQSGTNNDEFKEHTTHTERAKEYVQVMQHPPEATYADCFPSGSTEDASENSKDGQEDNANYVQTNEIPDKLIKSIPKDLEKAISRYVQDTNLSEYIECFGDPSMAIALLSLIFDRFEKDGMKVSDSELDCLLNRILMQRNNLEQLFPIFEEPQELWMKKHVLLQLSTLLGLEELDKGELYDLLKSVSQSESVLTLANKLDEYYIDDNFEEDRSKFPERDVLSKDDARYIVEQMGKLQLKDEQWTLLSAQDISQWKEELGLIPATATLKRLPVEWGDDQRLREAAFYLNQLDTRHAKKVMEHLEICAKAHGFIPACHTIDMLRTLSTQQSTIDNRLTLSLKGHWDKWKENDQEQIRKINEIKQIMEKDKLNSEFVQNKICKVKELHNDAQYEWQSHEGCSKACSTLHLKIEDWDEVHIKRFMKNFKKGIPQNPNKHKEHLLRNLPVLIPVINRGIKLTRKFTPRDTQWTSILLFLLAENKGLLEQVSTGEGKSLITTIMATIKALYGNKVDIITSSYVLAERDAAENRDIYELFEVSAGHNCSNETGERNTSYKDKQVVYGEIGMFQRDLLLDSIYDTSIRGGRKFDCIIVDEVDSMVLDNGTQVIYLTHDIPGMEDLTPLFVSIWYYANAKDLMGSKDAKELVYQCVMNDMGGMISDMNIKEALQIGNNNPSDSEVTAVKCFLHNQGILDTDGNISNREDIIAGKIDLHDLDLTPDQVQCIRLFSQSCCTKRTQT